MERKGIHFASGENLANLVTLELTQIVNCGCSSHSTKVLHGRTNSVNFFSLNAHAKVMQKQQSLQHDYAKPFIRTGHDLMLSWMSVRTLCPLSR